MKPNVTCVKEFLPIELKEKFSKSDMSECCFILRNRLNIPITRELHSEAIALVYKNEILVARDNKIRKEKKLRVILSELYRYCMRYKLDCYAACCRYIEYRLGNFIECPDRIPANTKYSEKEGYWWDEIAQKAGYYKQSCADILDSININNGTKEHHNHNINPVEYVYFNYKDDFIDFVNKKYKILPKHFNRGYADYSHLAYNNSADDF